MLVFCFLVFISSSLPLFKAGILFVNNIQLAFSTYNFAINAALFNGCSYFHDFVSLDFINRN